MAHIPTIYGDDFDEWRVLQDRPGVFEVARDEKPIGRTYDNRAEPQLIVEWLNENFDDIAGGAQVQDERDNLGHDAT